MTLVHVVGESDTGLARPGALTEPDRRARLAGWRAAVTAVLTDAGALATLLRDGWSGDLSGGRTTPLAGLLPALGAKAVDLLLVAGPPDSAGVPSRPVADGLAAAFAAWPGALGPAAAVTAVTAAGFDDDAVADRVRAVLAGAGDPVVMSWGSGSTGIALGALAGVVESGRPWLLRDSFAPTQDLVLRPAGRADPLVAWLLRLGYPGRVLGLDAAGALDPPLEPDVRAYAQASHARLVAVAARGSNDADDLAELVRTELRRRDGTSALAVRAWLEARYARLRAADRPTPVDLLAAARDLGGLRSTPTLGEAIERLGRGTVRDTSAVERSLRSASGTWLTDVAKRINDAVRSPAHRWRALPADTVQDIEKRLPALAGVGARFGPSTGIVQVVWPVGAPGRAREVPYATRVLETELDPRVLLQAGRGTRAEVDVRCTLLASSTESAEYAGAQRRMLADGAAGSGYRRLTAELVDVGERPRGAAVARAQEAVAAHLATARRQPDVLVVVPVGPKPVVVAAFAAAVAHGRHHAIPVLVECTDRDRTAVGYHRIGGYLGADGVLAEVARDAVARLELDTAVRLLDLGSPGLRELAGRVATLADDVRATVDRAMRARPRRTAPAPDVPDRDLAALMALFRAAVPHHRDEVDRRRLAHLAGTHAHRTGAGTLNNLRNRLAAVHGNEPAPDADTLSALIDHELGGRPEPRLADAYGSLLDALAAALAPVA